MYPKLIELLSWNGPIFHVCCFILSRASTETFVSQKIRQQGHSLAEVSLYLVSVRHIILLGTASPMSNVDHVYQYVPHIFAGTAVAQWLSCCAANRRVAVSNPDGVSGYFIDIKSFRSHYDPGVDSTSNRNEYQEHFLEGKSGRCVRLTTLPPSCAVVTKSGNPNLLETELFF